MKKAVCFGINHYPNPQNDLRGCVNDAHDWKRLLVDFGFSTEIFVNDQVTEERIIDWLEEAARESKPGDVFVLTYSGHGTRTYDTSGDEIDGYDEALFVYDRIVTDDALRKVIDEFDVDCRVIIILDSCHSGTATRAPCRRILGELDYIKPKFVETVAPLPGLEVKRSLKDLSKEGTVDILISGCDDDEYSYDAYINGRWNGAFTANAVPLVKYNTTYQGFYEQLLTKLPSGRYPQTPQLEGNSNLLQESMFGWDSVSHIDPPVDPPVFEPPTTDKPELITVKYWWVFALIGLGIVVWAVLQLIKGC